MAGIPFSIVNTRSVSTSFTSQVLLSIGPVSNNILLIDMIRFGVVVDDLDYLQNSITFEIGFGTDYGPGNTDISSNVSRKNSLQVETPAVSAYYGTNAPGNKKIKELITLYANGSDEYIWFSHWDADDIKITDDRTMYVKIAESHLPAGAFELVYTISIEGEV